MLVWLLLCFLVEIKADADDILLLIANACMAARVFWLEIKADDIRAYTAATVFFCG